MRTSVDDLAITPEIAYGTADSVLIDRGEHARFLVIGMHTVLGSALIGRTTTHVATRARCPVVVWRGTAGRPIPRRRPIVVGVDGTRLSRPAIECAFELAAVLGVPLAAVHAWPPGIEPVGRPSGGDIEHRAILAESLAGWHEKFPDVQVTESAVAGAAVPVPMGATADAQLLVVRSRARAAAAAVLLGSTSRDLLHRTPCPVLICRGFAD